MAYRLRLSESLASGLHRVARSQFELAIGELQKPEVGPDQVHSCRKSIKRLRALLRLVRPSLSDADWRRRNRGLRDVARLLSEQRDKAVLCDTISELERAAEAGGDATLHSALQALRQIIGSSESELRAPLDGKIAAQARRRLSREARDFQKLRLSHKTKLSLRLGVAKSYRRGRRALKAAYSAPNPEAFHELRKAVQWHWRHMSLLERAWPEVMVARASEARNLSQALGEDHDIAVLAEFAERQSSLTDASKQIIATYCAERQAALREAIEGRVRRLFAEPSEEFAERLRFYWSEARQVERALRQKPDREAEAGDSAPTPAKARKSRKKANLTGQVAAKTPG